MTEKRFQWVYIQEDKVIRLNDNGIVKHFPPQRLEELLNELKDENERLQQQIKDMEIRFKRKYDYEFDEIVDELE